MDIDQLKSATEDQMELIMTTMMSNMDKFPDFCGGSYAAPEASDFISAGMPHHHFLDHASSIINHPSTVSFQEPTKPGAAARYSAKRHSMAAMREMIFRIAAMQPIHIDPEAVKPPKRRNVRISKDPQSVAARHRRERISERIRILQRLVPGGTKMDTASMLDEAIHYVKFLKSQVQTLERAAATNNNNNNNALTGGAGIGFPVAMSSGSYMPVGKPYAAQNVENYGDA